MKEEIRHRLLKSGAVAVGFAKAGDISLFEREDYKGWIDAGFHGEMEYLHRHEELRNHTDSVMPGAKTVISLAFNYEPEEWLGKDSPYISAYAYGKDYHNALREVLRPAISDFKEQYGGEWRICIDTAPVAERYWALKSGIGIRGLNCGVIIEGYGSFIFLAEIMTTLEIPADSQSERQCSKCGECLRECPTKALQGDGRMDSRKCINYLTIEKKSELSEEEIGILKKGPGYLAGCDRCLKVCPYNQGKNELTKVFTGHNSRLSAFDLRKEIKELRIDDLQEMGKDEFKKRFKDSPLLYVGLERLQRNARGL